MAAGQGEDIPTLSTNEIMVSKAFFQSGFGLPSCNFFYNLLNHFKIQLVHLTPNSILQIIVFVHLCDVYLKVFPSFALFKTYFFLKYQPSTSKHQTISKVGMQARANHDFLALPLKTSLNGCIPSGSTVRITSRACHPLSNNSPH
jgi:hypothetical protein